MISEGVLLIQDERSRQVAVEGFTKDKDDLYKEDELLRAAFAYMAAMAIPEGMNPEDSKQLILENFDWPWDEAWFKPKGKIRNLQIAGALIAAEIDRRVRLGETE